MNAISPQIQQSWNQVSGLFKIQNEQDYDRAVERLNTLLDEVSAVMCGIRSILCLIRLARFFTTGKSNTMPCLTAGDRMCCDSSWRSTV